GMTAERHELGSHRAEVRSLAWSPSGATLACGCSDGAIRLWDVDQERLLQLMLGHEGVVAGIAWSPNGRTLMSVGLTRWPGCGARPTERCCASCRPTRVWQQASRGSPMGSSSPAPAQMESSACGERKAHSHCRQLSLGQQHNAHCFTTDSCTSVSRS